ncbi:MAG TPA: FliH/SctL family protein [Tepidisphaeraceae bacterium]|jgi:flagellar biosynthesis/type III secretory pathway protein FliH
MDKQPGQSSAREARILRAASASGARVAPLYPSTRLLKGAVVEAEQSVAEAHKTRDLAVSEAAAIRQAAMDEANAVRQNAFENGARDAAAEFGQMLENFEGEIDKLKARFAVDVQKVAFRFAKAILDVEFVAKPDRVADLVATVLKPARMYNQVTVHLHPDDVERVRKFHAQLVKRMAFAHEIKFSADDQLPLHGVRVETEMGSYDGNIDTQIRRLQNHLFPDSKPAGEAAGSTGEPA